MSHRTKAILATIAVLILCCTQSGCLIYCGFIFALDIAFLGADPSSFTLEDCATHFTYATVTSAPSGGEQQSNSSDTFEPMSLPAAPNPNPNSYSPPPPLVVAGPAAPSQPNAAAGKLPPNLPPVLQAIPQSNRQAPAKFGNLGGPL